MSKAGTGEEPPRLVSRDDRAGRLLREAESAFLPRISPDRAWNRFQSRRHRHSLLRFAVLAAGVGAAAAFMSHRMAAPAPIEAPQLVAEQVLPPQPSAVTPDQAAVQDAAVQGRRVSPSPSLARRARSSSASISVSHTIGAPPAEEPPSDVTCRRWVSHSRLERAVDCYLTLARGSGIGAEVALYEAARLSAEALDDAPRALALLEQHGARFPDSVLRVEVEWLKIRSLERAGRLDEALTASEALLDSAVGRSLAPKLHLLRGRIHADARHDCARALPEYVALLGEPGAAGDEAELKRAQCLEQLKRPDEARSAYQRYLSRADARSAGAARARLLAISNSDQSPEGQP